jgi:1-acyl-sn-glycerol-3-phosphate acyltransferase
LKHAEPFHRVWYAHPMARTIFNTPGVSSVLKAFSGAFLRATGWHIEGQLPAEHRRSVLIAAPHTSNWDLPYTLMVAFVLGLDVRWMGKHTLFKFPFGPVMRWLGGIAVNREQSNNLVAASADNLRSAKEPFQLVVPPEGTRSKTRYWKTGFYYIAQAANVPIVMAYMDFSQKRSGLGPVFQPTGNIEQDMAAIKAFYAPFKGKNAQQFET